MDLLILSIALLCNMLKLIIFERTKSETAFLLIASMLVDVIIVSAYYFTH